MSVKEKLGRCELFATRNKIEEAFQFVDDLVNTLRPEDQMTAYTAAYVLYNSAIKHMEDEDGEV